MSAPGSDPRLLQSPGRPVHGLSDLVRLCASAEGVRRGDLAPGDRLLVATKNSIYSLETRADGLFDVSGGAFARRQGGTGGVCRIAVAGCTAGGRALFTNIIAAPQLFLEFADGTSTTRIRRVRLIPGSWHGPRVGPVEPVAVT